MTFASVLQYTDESVKQCRELANFLRKRSQVEMEYAKGLYKLSQSFPRPSGVPGSTSQVNSPSSTPATSRSASIADGALFGGLSRIGVVPTVSPPSNNEVVGTSVWNAFYDYVDGMTKMAEGHRTLALNLQNNVLDAFSNLIKDMDAVRKSQADRGAGYIKNLQDAYSGLKKAKKEYNTAKVAAQESQNAHQKARATHHSRERDLDKLASRASSALDKADYANEALRVCEEICKNAQEHYYGHLLPVLYDEIRKNELDRCASVKKALVDSLYLEKLYGGDARLAAIDSATDRLTHIDINEDVEAFVDAHMIDEPGKKEHNVSVSMLVNPVKAGRMLLKRGDFIAGWKSRYFVLMAENGLLYCFDDEAALKPREVITLHMCSIHPLDDSYFGRANCLQVMCIGDTARGRQTYNLITESGQEKEEWLRALQRFTFCCTKAAYSALEEVGAAAFANAKVDADDSSSMMSRSTGALAAAVRDILPNVSLDDLDAVQIVRTFQISILDAKELPSSPGLGDVRPYCIILFDDVKQARTMTKSGDAPFWGEEFEFGDFCPHFSRLRIVLFNQNRLQRDVDLGYVSIQLQGVEPGTRVEQWYSIKQLPRGAGALEESTSSLSGKRTGSIRIGFCLSVQQLLPMKYYQQFLDAVTEPNLVCVKMLGAVCGSQREALAKKLIHVLAARNAEIQGLSTLLDDEIASTDNPNIIFRGNSLATKAVDQYMKLVGGTYLSETLTAWVRTVYSSREACEVDPTRVDSAEVLAKNWRRLMGFVNSVWDVIRSSATSCPQEFVGVFGHIRGAVEKKWPVETEPQSSSVQYASISGFLFLRFFCPAILNPKLFGLVPEHPDPPIARTLTLVAKTLQNLANLSDFGSKEGYMSECNTFIDSNMDAMKNFIDQVSGRGGLQPSQLPTWSGSRTPLQVRQDAENLYTFFLSNMDSLQRECGTTQGPYVEDCVRAVRIVRDHHADLDFKDDVEYPPKISSRKSSIVSIASDRVPELPPRLELLGLDGIAAPTNEVPHKPATHRQSRHFGLALSNRDDTTEHANGSFEDIQLILERMGSTEGASFPQHDSIPTINVRQASLDSHPGSPTYAAPTLPIPPPRTRSRSGGSMRTSQSLNTLSSGALTTHVEEPPMPPLSQHTYSRKKSVAKGFLRHFLPGNHSGATGEPAEVSPVSPRQFFSGGSTRRRGSEDAVWMQSGGRTKALPADYHMSQPVRNAKGPRPSLDSVISSNTHDAPESPHVPNPDIVDTYPPPRPPTPSSSSTSLSSKTDKEKGNKSRWSVIWKGSSGSLHNGN